MSRKTIYQDSRLTVVGGEDHMLGKFLQIFDKEMENETPEGEGLVFDWSERFGIERNFTGYIYDEPQKVIDSYINECKEDVRHNINLN